MEKNTQETVQMAYLAIDGWMCGVYVIGWERVEFLNDFLQT